MDEIGGGEKGGRGGARSGKRVLINHRPSQEGGRRFRRTP